MDHIFLTPKEPPRIEIGEVIDFRCYSAKPYGLTGRFKDWYLFLPKSLIHPNSPDDLQNNVGQEFEVEVIKHDPRYGILVVDRFNLVRRQTYERLSVDLVVEGQVTDKNDGWVFVKLSGGLVGLLRRDVVTPEMAKIRNELAIGDVVRAKVLKKLTTDTGWNFVF